MPRGGPAPSGRGGRPGSYRGGAAAPTRPAPFSTGSRPASFRPARAAPGTVRDSVYAEALLRPVAARPGPKLPAADPPATSLPSQPHEASGRVRPRRSRRRQGDPVRPHRRGEARAAAGSRGLRRRGPRPPVASADYASRRPPRRLCGSCEGRRRVVRGPATGAAGGAYSCAPFSLRLGDQMRLTSGRGEGPAQRSVCRWCVWRVRMGSADLGSRPFAAL
ncbi:hypothetical protein GHT09_003095 [Marmota monax]|uniref:Uncharacterized protein n=1 Tax=Marmota monax TaxID=9995 RepID=A0A834V6G9_MARMO|nr:hypothetical protein GHT09_003095 [Marmota monax]